MNVVKPTYYQILKLFDFVEFGAFNILSNFIHYITTDQGMVFYAYNPMNWNKVFHF